jgi:site-specific DNA-methyltransferase (adenine-specific)
VSLKKRTQNGPRGVYQFVPIQNFDIKWTDDQLNKKYGLTQEEIDFIDKRIRQMDL